MIYTPGKTCSLDIESNGLLEDSIDFTKGFPLVLKNTSKLWCISITDAETKVTVNIVHNDTQTTRSWLKQVLLQYDTVILHNGVKFDLPLLSLFGVIDYKIGYSNQRDTIFNKEMNIIDTLILSRILNPSRLNGHGLKQWGIRLGNNKIDFRDKLIQLGALKPNSPKGAEFLEFHPEMIPYCDQDALLTCDVFDKLWIELLLSEHKALKIEHKLADLAVNREMFGFDFDIEGAKNCVVDLDSKLNNLRDIVNPVLPEKYLNQSELNLYTPPKNQVKKNGDISAHMLSFIKIHNLELFSDISTKKTIFTFDGNNFEIGHQDPIKSYKPGDISDIDHVKHFLIELGWIPTEWRIRDLTKTADKKTLPFDKRVTALKRYLKETYEGKYTNARCKELKIKDSSDKDEYKRVYKELYLKLRDDFPVRVITSPATKVGVSKELCPNLIALGDKVEFAKHFGLYSTYKHRRSCIADKEYFVEDSDDLVPEKGYLHSVRADGRISTPAIEIGATSNRYKHSVVANVPRASSIYGKEMRSLFRAGNEYFQLGFDFSSLENRVQGGYVMSYPDGPELAVTLLAEKPNDLHCFSEDTEILTESGWKRFDNITKSTKVAQYCSDTKEISWTNPEEIVSEHFIGKMINIKNSNTDQLVTLNHRIYTEELGTKNGKIDIAKDFINKKYRSRRFVCGGKLLTGTTESEDFIKLIIATQADGYLAKDSSSITFSFVRKDKIDRLNGILCRLGVKFAKYEHFRKNRVETTFRLNASPDTVKIRSWLDKDKNLCYNLLSLNFQLRQCIIDEIQKWDGTKTKNGIVLDTTSDKSVQVLQSICTSVGLKSTITYFNKKCKTKNVKISRLFISTVAKCTSGISGTDKSIVDYSGKIGCVSVPTGLIVVRRNGKVFVSGNSIVGVKLGISRTDAKSFNYAVLYGAFINKLAAMLNKSFDEAKILYEEFWNSVPALKALKEDLTQEWIRNDKKYITGIDGRRIYTRSEHSLLNYLFQSGGVIAAKYTTVFIFEELESKGYCISPFKGVPDVCSMIEYHDECQIGISKKSKIIKEIKYFITEQEAEEFKKSYVGNNQLSNIKVNSDPTKGFFICLPNAVSIAIENATKRTEKVLDLQFELGFEWDLGKNWYQCH